MSRDAEPAQPTSARTEVGRGTVASYDESGGWGVVQRHAGDGEVYPFHCTAIADGSRSIMAGAAVTFRLAPGLHGRWEAIDINER